MYQPRPTSNPGQYDRRATLQSRTDTRDAFGGLVPTWATVATVWAAWEPTDGRETVASAQLQPLRTGILTLRAYRSDITAAWRVVLGGTAFEITAPPVEIGRRAGIELQLRALSASTVSP